MLRPGNTRVFTVRIWLEPHARGGSAGDLRIHVHPVRGLTGNSDRYFRDTAEFAAWFDAQVASLDQEER